jgi:hypothetical protein
MKRPISPELVRDVAFHLSQKYHTTFFSKYDQWEMQLAGSFLETLGVLDRDYFLEHYATTLGKRIYTPFEIGSPGSEDELLSQLRTITHEHVHALQYINGGEIFGAEYLASEAKRAHYEAQAYTANLEIHFLYTGKILDLESMSERLQNYKVGRKHRRTCLKHLEIVSETIKVGGIITEPGKYIIEYILGRSDPD